MQKISAGISEYHFIKYSRNPEKNYAVITLNRPEVMNALNLEIRKEILDALDHAESDDSVRVLVLTGAGEKAFSAGADVKMFQTMTPFTAREYLKTSKGTSNRLENFSKPVIAVVNGHAIGGGLELAMSCDIMLASSNAKFGQTEINVGLIPGVGGTQRLPRRIGIHRAKELIFTGDLIDSTEAQRLGIVNHVFPSHEEMWNYVEAMIEKISSKSPIILRLGKEAVNHSSAGLKEGLDYESTLFEFCFSTNDQKEGARAFLEKQSKPAFTGS
jgi:enoyl-CoA hydratase